ncbi:MULTISPECIES: TnsA-like heteromeric transposase endonuclease subunit [unclassified Streptomyces]|uniref:TnsA-like heteromeric transposase endonuclease subunit n=1 Tax=unclassified Streptomyces TaxID=2593676 RepID=UPI002E7A346C|nr:TnsA-like heteromeric transposase endonuclease subunit [Streptomyces sp. JV190]MEE1843729.1 TnsA-like heteromeric transposase endonuclease subunit [Streptomyces sp. JV190]
MDDLVAPYTVAPGVFGRLETGPGWARRWTAAWKTSGAGVICSVQDLADFPALASVPARGFTWRARQRHRPGLQYMVATGRMHGFESLAERRLLLALDFLGGVEEVLSQPFKLRFTTGDGSEDHTPDYLVLLRGAAVLVDVRPGHLIKDEDLVKFAAAEQAAAAAGWRYVVVTGWRRHMVTGLDALSARRRAMSDRLGLEGELLELVAERPRRFVELVEGTSLPAVARAHAVHLLWHRRLAVDLSQPLCDAAWIYPAERP